MEDASRPKRGRSFAGRCQLRRASIRRSRRRCAERGRRCRWFPGSLAGARDGDATPPMTAAPLPWSRGYEGQTSSGHCRFRCCCSWIGIGSGPSASGGIAEGPTPVRARGPDTRSGTSHLVDEQHQRGAEFSTSRNTTFIVDRPNFLDGWNIPFGRRTASELGLVNASDTECRTGTEREGPVPLCRNVCFARAAQPRSNL